MNTTPICGASIPVPPPSPTGATIAPTVSRAATWTQAQWDKFHDELGDLKYRFGADVSRQQQAITLIKACIAEGVDTIGLIIKVLGKLGFGRGHVASILTRGKSHPWRKDAAGIYTLIAN